MLPRVDKSAAKTQRMGDIAALMAVTEFFSDGTLGHYAQFANLAVGGWGWCALDSDGQLIGAIYGTLEGDEQTVPRAELRAILSILETVPYGAKIVIRVDASYLLGFRNDPEAKCRSDNGDMWLECWRLIVSKNIDLSVVKIARSHASDAMVQAGIVSLRDKTGNDHADRFAELGAALTLPDPEQISATMRTYESARYIQLRLADATHIQLTRSGTRPRATPPAAVVNLRLPDPPRQWNAHA